MKNSTTVKRVNETGQPSRRARGIVQTDKLSDQIVASSGGQPVVKLKLNRFQIHQFTPKIQVLQDGSLWPPGEFTASEWQRMGRMVHVLHRIRPGSLSLIKNLPTDLC